MLNFDNLRSQVDGYRGAFEGLVCQVAHRLTPENAKEFVYINGAGGDGGIEAYWILNDGSEIGYQAKFHTKTSDIDWAKISHSVQAALSSRPKMTEMVIAVACDLTDFVPNRRGKSGREKWDEHKARWEQYANELGRDVTFTFWGSSHLEQDLTKPETVGLRAYWFNSDFLDQNWFCQQFDNTVARLEERFNPDDHVELSVREAFDGVLRSDKWRAKLHELVDGLSDACNAVSWGRAPSDVEEHLKTCANLCRPLFECRNQIDLKPDVSFPVGDWDKYLRALLKQLKICQQAIYEQREWPEHDEQREKLEEGLSFARDRYLIIFSAAENLRRYLASSVFQSDEKRFCLVTGRAGAGKSHLLASELQAALKNGGKAIILLGSDFSEHNTLENQIIQRLSITDLSFDDFLGALSSAAEASGQRALIAIDAINEGGQRRWQRELPELARRIHQYPWLAFVVSCRSEFQDYLVSQAVIAAAIQIEVLGFFTAEEQELAAQQYMDKRGIRRPATNLWFPPEYTNPLFLRTACIALEKNGETELPKGLNGTGQIFRFYINALSVQLGTSYDGSNELLRPLLNSITAIAAQMAESRLDYLPRSAVQNILTYNFGSYDGSADSWIDVLRKNGVFRFDTDPNFESSDPMDFPDDVVRFAFQRFQDHLIAKEFVKDLEVLLLPFAEGGKLSFMRNQHGISYAWAGVFEALWVIVAEQFEAELLDWFPEEEREDLWTIYQIQSAFVESIYWRQPDSFSDRSRELLNGLWGHDDPINILLKIGLLDHPWNAEFLDRNLKRYKLAQRDEFWTVHLNQLSYDDEVQATPHRIVDWCLGSAVERADCVTLKRALILLGWFFTSTEKRLRDKATKAAMKILLHHPSLTADFIQNFIDVDDVYVVERVLAAVAGACLRDPSCERLTQASDVIYQAVFADGEPPCLRAIKRLVNGFS